MQIKYISIFALSTLFQILKTELLSIFGTYSIIFQIFWRIIPIFCHCSKRSSHLVSPDLLNSQNIQKYTLFGRISTFFSKIHFYAPIVNPIFFYQMIFLLQLSQFWRSVFFIWINFDFLLLQTWIFNVLFNIYKPWFGKNKIITRSNRLFICVGKFILFTKLVLVFVRGSISNILFFHVFNFFWGYIHGVVVWFSEINRLFFLKKVQCL